MIEDLRCIVVDSWTAEQVIAESLEALGVTGDAQEDYVLAVASALPGWPWMFARLERNPQDRTPRVPVALEEFIAVRLVFERHAVAHACGMLFAAIGAAGRGHQTAALLVVLTTSAAMGGLDVLVTSLEERAGPVRWTDRADARRRSPAWRPPPRSSGRPVWRCPAPPGSSPTTCCSTPSGRKVWGHRPRAHRQRGPRDRNALRLVAYLPRQARGVVGPGLLLTPAEAFLGGAEHMLAR